MIWMKLIFMKYRMLLPLTMFALLGGMQCAFADQPEPWQMGFQPAATPVMEQIHTFHELLLYILVAITVFVLALLVYVSVRFNEKANPVPSKTTHNTLLEVAWTVIPIVILVVISVTSLKLLYFMDKTHNPEMTLKVTGHQWYWQYEYPDNGGFTFDSFMVADEDLKEGQPRMLTVDEEVVLPINTDIRILVASDDVIHNWSIPSFGIKIDLLPGRINETWVRITREGVFKGQCSELCGTNHGFMPISVRAVSKEAYQLWVKEAQEQYARVRDDNVRVAKASNSLAQ
jgi:cytochrome c oxidase subunit 2